MLSTKPVHLESPTVPIHGSAQLHQHGATATRASRSAEAGRGVSNFDAVSPWSLYLQRVRLRITFVEKDGTEHTFEVAEGDNLLDIAQANELEMEGACGGSCACSTCHVIVQDDKHYDLLPEPEDDENDMLDLAFGLTETSRLGCQVKMVKAVDGMVVKLPSMTRNMQVGDFS